MAEFSAGATVAGKYTLIGRVGQGGMGDVWIARNESTGGDVAIKTLRPDRRMTDQAEERFRHEARVSARLRHPNIARVYDLTEEDQTLLLVMERLHGGSLKEKLLAGPIDPDEMIDIALPILDALAAAHEAGIVHRDVTPGNIMLAQEGNGIVPKLIDFGVAKANDAAVTTKTGHALGTPQYMSPEQIRHGVVDGRSDLFSLAVTMYEAITGINPFKRSTPSGSLAAVLETEVDPDPRIPPQLWMVLSRNLSKQPYERDASAAEMARALRSVRQGAEKEPPAPNTASPAILDTPPPAPPRRSWLPLGLGAAGIAIAFGVLAVVFFRSDPAKKAEASLPRSTTPATTTPATPVTSAIVIPQSPSAIVIPPPPAPTTSASSAAPIRSKPVRPASTPAATKPKPVATTPDF